jgi:hypothetical protein
MQNLKPCPFRHVDEEGHILCEKIKIGDREVSPNVCRACPVAGINCAHLRAMLSHQVRPPITVRYGNGRTEIWEDDTPSITLERAACAAKVIPILSPRDCAGCALRQALVSPDGILIPVEGIQPAAARRPQKSMPAAPPPAPAAPAPAPVSPAVVQAEKERSSIVARKIIKLQEWLEKQKNAKPERESPEADVTVAVGARQMPRPARSEEKRVGWTD